MKKAWKDGVGAVAFSAGATQLHYTHGVPKTRDVVGERISQAFRVKADRVRAGGSDSDAYR
jgi:hypothetical protein